MSLKITKIFQVKLENILESQEYKIRFKSIKISKKLCTKNDIIILKKIDTIES
jgi:hypothetical protein